jgi:hypothetical protein
MLFLEFFPSIAPSGARASREFAACAAAARGSDHLPLDARLGIGETGTQCGC